MRTFLIYVCRLMVVGAVLYGAFEPNNGVMFRSLGMSLALGLVGLGLVLDARQRALQAAATTDQVGTGRQDSR